VRGEKVDAGTGQASRKIACFTCRVHHLRRERKIAAAGATKLRARCQGVRVSLGCGIR